MKRAMHDPKFEQEVQRRMHDLEFVPSESVWAGIRQGIAPRKRRRAVVLFWWLFPGMLLVAGGVVLSRHSASVGGVAAAVPAVETGKPAGGAAVQVDPHGNSGAGNGIVGNEKETGGAGTEVRPRGNGGNVISVRPRGKEGGVIEVAEDGTGGEEGVAGADVGAAVARQALRARYHPGLVSGLGYRRGINAPPPEWQPVKTAVSGINQPRHPWAVGFAAGGGAASVYSSAGAPLTTLPTSNTGAGNSLVTYYNIGRPQALASNPSAGGA